MLGPGRRAHFEFKLADWLGGTDDGGDIRSEVTQITGIPLLCANGTDEHDSLCTELSAAKIVALPGGGTTSTVIMLPYPVWCWGRDQNPLLSGDYLSGEYN